MNTRRLEERIAALEAANDRLEKSNERLEAIQAITNMVNRYEYMLPAGLYDDVLALFSKRPDVSVEIGPHGVYEGTEALRTLYLVVHKMMQGDPVSGMNPGIFTCNPNSNPVIEIAGDGQTAKGLWVAAGPGVIPVEGRLTGFWLWTKRAYDFIKEEGEWKIWHYHVYNIFNCPYDKCWTEINDFIGKWPLPEELAANKPTTYHWVWTPRATVEYVPSAPSPYETFDPATRY